MELTIKFDVGDLLGTPMIKIQVDDYLILYDGPACSKFNYSCEIAPGHHELKIVHYGKTDNDHVLNQDGSIKIDKFVQVANINIDNVNLRDSELQEGQFWPVYSQSYVETLAKSNQDLPLYICPNLYLGHNGTWKWDFYYPFVDWIIAKRSQGPVLNNTIFKTSNDVLIQAKDFFNNVQNI